MCSTYNVFFGSSPHRAHTSFAYYCSLYVPQQRWYKFEYICFAPHKCVRTRVLYNVFFMFTYVCVYYYFFIFHMQKRIIFIFYRFETDKYYDIVFTRGVFFPFFPLKQRMHFLFSLRIRTSTAQHIIVHNHSNWMVRTGNIENVKLYVYTYSNAHVHALQLKWNNFIRIVFLRVFELKIFA